MKTIHKAIIAVGLAFALGFAVAVGHIDGQQRPRPGDLPSGWIPLVPSSPPGWKPIPASALVGGREVKILMQQEHGDALALWVIQY